MTDGAVQPAVAELLSLTPVLADDVEFAIIERATPILDRLTHLLSQADIRALFSLLPPGGDTAYGLNWAILHAIEASPSWPMWELLPTADEGHEWRDIFSIRLENGGYKRPDAP